MHAEPENCNEDRHLLMLTVVFIQLLYSFEILLVIFFFG